MSARPYRVIEQADDREKLLSALWKLRALGHKGIDLAEVSRLQPPLRSASRWALIERREPS